METKVYAVDGKSIQEQAALLEHQNAQLKMQANLLNLSNDAIFAWGLDGAIIYWNKGAETMYGYSGEEAVGSDSHELLKTKHPSGLVPLLSHQAGDGSWNGEIEHTTKEGKKLIIQTRQQVILDEFGNKIVLETNRDITKCIMTENEIKDSLDKNTEIFRRIEKQNEQILQNEIDKNEILSRDIEMKDEFISLISHEFKTPITVINAATETIEFICKDELSEKSKRYLHIIKQNSNRQLKLVNNLLDVTRALTGHLKICKKDMDIVELTGLITRSITVFAEQKGIKLSFSSTIKHRVIGIDAEKYERVLLNLLSNAVKFTPNGKSIAVKVSQKIVDRKCKIGVSVKDEGVGIPREKQKLIFERFGQADTSRTRSAEGTGIGLHLVKMLVELMDGEIALESKEGAGSTFTVILPIEKTKKLPIESMGNETTFNRFARAEVEFSDIYYKQTEK